MKLRRDKKSVSDQTPQPSPELFFQTINAYQRTATLKAAIELNLFTVISEGAQTAQEIAARCGASERRRERSWSAITTATSLRCWTSLRVMACSVSPSLSSTRTQRLWRWTGLTCLRWLKRTHRAQA